MLIIFFGVRKKIRKMYHTPLASLKSKHHKHLVSGKYFCRSRSHV